MAVADIGTGGGAMAVVLGKWIGTGRVYATDITERALRTTREYAKKEGLTNVTVMEGGADRTNLPAACCDAVFLRQRLSPHHGDCRRSTRACCASLKPGGRLAIIDFIAERLGIAGRRAGESRRPRHPAGSGDRGNEGRRLHTRANHRAWPPAKRTSASPDLFIKRELRYADSEMRRDGSRLIFFTAIRPTEPETGLNSATAPRQSGCSGWRHGRIPRLPRNRSVATCAPTQAASGPVPAVSRLQETLPLLESAL